MVLMPKLTKFQRSLKAHKRLLTSHGDNLEKHLDAKEYLKELKGFIYHAQVVIEMNDKGRILTKQEKNKIYKDSYK